MTYDTHIHDLRSCPQWSVNGVSATVRSNMAALQKRLTWAVLERSRRLLAYPFYLLVLRDISTGHLVMLIAAITLQWA
jgi:hypothetical protein